MTTATSLQTDLKAILLRHEGPANAITAGELALICGKSDRVIRLAIRELRRDTPILSSGTGFFMPTSRDQVEYCLASLRSRLIEDSKTRRDIKVSAALYFTPARQERLL
jgi:hypothetical protein